MISAADSFKRTSQFSAFRCFLLFPLCLPHILNNEFHHTQGDKCRVMESHSSRMINTDTWLFTSFKLLRLRVLVSRWERCFVRRVVVGLVSSCRTTISKITMRHSASSTTLFSSQQSKVGTLEMNSFDGK